MATVPRFSALHPGRAFCALMSCLTLSTQVGAVEASAAEPLKPIEELVELDEVKVRGRLVANAVIRTENLVFRRYNSLNKDDHYDVHCGDVRRSPDSLAMLRMCLPEFLGDFLAAPRLMSTSFGPGFPGTLSGCGRASSGVDANGNMHSMSACPAGFGTSSYSYYSPPYYSGSSFTVPAVPAQRAVISTEARAEFVQNMSRVLNSDPELKDMATELAGMYGEVDRVQAQYVRLLEERRTAQSAKMAAARERARQRGRELRPPHPRAL